jgi:ABC-type transporter Mla subunit MlaD
LNHAAARIDPIMEQIEQVSEDSSVVSGKLRSEAEQLPGLIQRLQDTSAELRTFVSSLREAGHELPPATKSIRDAAERIPSLVLQAQEAVRDIETLAEALRQRFAPGARTALPPGRKVAPGDAAP